MSLPVGDPGRRTGHAPAAAHRDRSEDARRGRRPSVRRASARAAAPQGVDRRRLSASAYLGEQVDEALGDGARWGLRFRLRASTVRRLLGTGGALMRALPLVTEGGSVLRDLRRLVPRCAIQPTSKRAFRAERPGRTDDRLPERRSLGPQQRRVRERPNRSLRQDCSARRRCSHIDYGLGVLTADALLPWVGRDEPFDLAAVYQRLVARTSARRVRSARAVLRDWVVTKGSKRRGRTSPAPPRGSDHELRATAPERSGRDRRVSSTRTPSSASSTLLAATRARGGRLFFLGVGGSAGNCSHAVTISASSPASRPMRRPTTSRS